MKQFKEDIMHWKDYDFTVINDKVEKCYKQIVRFINSKKLKIKYMRYDKKYIDDHIKTLIN